jgi:aspartyl-tRNA(Asn)/glutamyl-tRNA(Gln) amidotransferase subunit A
MALAPSMDKIGPMARSAEDCARIFAVLAGHDPKDHGTLPVDKAAFTYSPSMELKTRSLTVGWLTNAWKTLDPSVAKIADATERALRKIFPAVHRVALPQGPWDDVGNVTMGIEGAASFRSLIRTGQVSELADPLGQINGYVNEQLPGADYLQAQRVRENLQKKMADLFDSFDVLATVSQPLPATPLDFNLETGLSFPDPLGAIGNLCGLPALSVPCGFTEKHLPVGLQFVARAGDDFAVILAGRTFQAHTEWHQRHPKLG